MGFTVWQREALKQIPNSQVARYAKDNLVVLDIYLRDPYVSHYVRREKVTVIRYGNHQLVFFRYLGGFLASFIGNVGGLLGLFLGFSFISVVEVFYIFLAGSDNARSEERFGSGGWMEQQGRKGRKFSNVSPTTVSHNEGSEKVN